MKTPGSGRKKGTPNKSRAPLEDKAQELCIDPFEILLYFAKGDWRALGYETETYTVFSGKEGDIANEELYIPTAVRARAASDACQYLYPKLKSIEHEIKTPPDSNQKQDVYLHWADETTPTPQTPDTAAKTDQ